MKTLNSYFLILITLALAMPQAGALARPLLYDLNIQVVLNQQGDAKITEGRDMQIDNEGTECYIVLQNLNGAELHQHLWVRANPNNQVFQYTDNWDTSWSRQQKAGKCGIVTTDKGYELCWGLGDPGRRFYATAYIMRSLLQGHDDADGFNWMFVSRQQSPLPQHVSVTIRRQDSIPFTSENTHIWAFGFKGNITLQDGAIYAESSEPFSSNSGLIILAEFQKGFFEPSYTDPSLTMAEVKELAIKGSDYTSKKQRSIWNLIQLGLQFLLLLLPAIIAIGAGIYKLVQVRLAARKVNKGLEWYRSTPYQGNLLHANGVINAHRFGSKFDGLLSAYLLRLVYIGAATIEQSTDAKGRVVRQLRMHPLPTEDGQTDGITLPPADSTDMKLQLQLWQILVYAAGDDRILQPKELERYMKVNSRKLEEFVNQLHTPVSLSACNKEWTEVRQLFGLKKFLSEFTLAAERHVIEVKLWKDYLIYATLFGMADQVLRDMKQVNPEFLKMDQVTSGMGTSAPLPTDLADFQYSLYRGVITIQNAKAARESAARNSGGGGSSSWGGGGGFSGGGSGGGVR